MSFWSRLSKRLRKTMRSMGLSVKTTPVEGVHEPELPPWTQPDIPQTTIDKLEKLEHNKLTTQDLEEYMLDDNNPLESRQQAFILWVNRTGWWRPDNNDQWSSAQWRIWEADLYQPEEEISW